jgi:hypothetical protein
MEPLEDCDAQFVAPLDGVLDALGVPVVAGAASMEGCAPVVPLAPEALGFAGSSLVRCALGVAVVAAGVVLDAAAGLGASTKT